MLENLVNFDGTPDNFKTFEKLEKTGSRAPEEFRVRADGGVCGCVESGLRLCGGFPMRRGDWGAEPYRLRCGGTCLSVAVIYFFIFASLFLLCDTEAAMTRCKDELRAIFA